MDRACPPLSALIGFPVTLPDGRSFKSLACRSQAAGTGSACVYWSFLNAYEALCRGLPRVYNTRGDDPLPRSWRSFYNDQVKYTCDGTNQMSAIKVLKDAGIGYPPDAPGVWFHPPVPGYEYLEIPKWPPRSYPHKVVFFSLQNLWETLQGYRRAQPLVNERKPVLGEDYVVVASFTNLAFPRLRVNDDEELDRVEEEGVAFVPNPRPDEESYAGTNVRGGHALIVYGLTPYKLLVWDTAQIVGQRHSRSICKRVIRREDVDPANPRKIRLMQWTIVGLNAEGRKTRDSTGMVDLTMDEEEEAPMDSELQPGDVVIVRPDLVLGPQSLLENVRSVQGTVVNSSRRGVSVVWHDGDDDRGPMRSIDPRNLMLISRQNSI